MTEETTGHIAHNNLCQIDILLSNFLQVCFGIWGFWKASWELRDAIYLAVETGVEVDKYERMLNKSFLAALYSGSPNLKLGYVCCCFGFVVLFSTTEQQPVQ